MSDQRQRDAEAKVFAEIATSDWKNKFKLLFPVALSLICVGSVMATVDGFGIWSDSRYSAEIASGLTFISMLLGAMFGAQFMEWHIEAKRIVRESGELRG